MADRNDIGRPEGLTETIAGFYNGLLAFLFVVVSAAALAGIAFVVLTILNTEDESAVGMLVLIAAAIIIGYLTIIVTYGLIATVLSIRNHVAYQTDVLLRISRRVGQDSDGQRDSLLF